MSQRRVDRQALTILIGGAPVVLLAWLGVRDLPVSMPSRISLWVVAVLAALTAVWSVRSRVAFRLRTVSNLLAALREGDVSFRLRSGGRGDPFRELALELNALTDAIRHQRLDEVEATALLRTVLGEIDVAVFAFDMGRQLRLVNHAGERLLARSAASATGLSAHELGLEVCLSGEPARTLALSLPGGGGRWELRRGSYRHLGRPHTLLVLSDVSRALRAEELAAWKRLIRVIGHELNNSLAPIRSLTGSLQRLVQQESLPEDWQEDLTAGLRVIGSRAEALNRFMGAYAALARLPEPTLTPVEVGSWVRRVAGLEVRREVTVAGGPEVTVQADGDQLDQLLINLVRNAVDAAAQTDGTVEVRWFTDDHWLHVQVLDTGPGLPPSANLFVPFFTTKPDGSGIGLVLCRQVAEGHGGSVTVVGRQDGPGCEARVRLPLRPPGSA